MADAGKEPASQFVSWMKKPTGLSSCPPAAFDNLSQSDQLLLQDELLGDLMPMQMLRLSIYAVCTAVTLALFIEETLFISRHFKNKSRCQKTIWVLAIFPVYSVTGLVGYMLPSTSPVLDLIATAFKSTCLYMLYELLINYLGGSTSMWSIIREGQLTVKFATLPFCCAFPCLPKKELDRKLLRVLRYMVLQVCIIRPLIVFVAAIMWANGSYSTGGLDLKSPFPYMTVINASTTLTAIYGLNLCKTAFNRPLRRFLILAKIYIVKLVLGTTALTPSILKLVYRLGLIKCDPVYEKSVQLDDIYRGVLVVSMLIYAIIARLLYRRMSDANSDVIAYRPEPEKDEDFKTQIINTLYIPRDIVSFLIRECCSGAETVASVHKELDDDFQTEVSETDVDSVEIKNTKDLVRSAEVERLIHSPTRKQAVLFNDDSSQHQYDNKSFSVESSNFRHGSNVDNFDSCNLLLALDMEDDVDSESYL